MLRVFNIICLNCVGRIISIKKNIKLNENNIFVSPSFLYLFKYIYNVLNNNCLNMKYIVYILYIFSLLNYNKNDKYNISMYKNYNVKYS